MDRHLWEESHWIGFYEKYGSLLRDLKDRGDPTQEEAYQLQFEGVYEEITIKLFKLSSGQDGEVISQTSTSAFWDDLAC